MNRGFYIFMIFAMAMLGCYLIYEASLKKAERLAEERAHQEALITYVEKLEKTLAKVANYCAEEIEND